jgi:hypothetical protein
MPDRLGKRERGNESFFIKRSDEGGIVIRKWKETTLFLLFQSADNEKWDTFLVAHMLQMKIMMSWKQHKFCLPRVVSHWTVTAEHTVQQGQLATAVSLNALEIIAVIGIRRVVMHSFRINHQYYAQLGRSVNMKTGHRNWIVLD